jgi:hypothetical protein
MKKSLIPQMGFGKQETAISRFIKNKRESLGLAIQEFLQKLHYEELELTLERYDEIESGKSDPTGEEFIKIKKVLEKHIQD